ncbi:hypothetical protein PENTCL1PPCAC_19654, partial [Pristionchus entomophagus]
MQNSIYAVSLFFSDKSIHTSSPQILCNLPICHAIVSHAANVVSNALPDRKYCFTSPILNLAWTNHGEEVICCFSCIFRNIHVSHVCR